MADHPVDLGRRAFLSRVASAIAAFLAAAIGLPLTVASVAAATRREEAPWIKIGPATDFQAGSPRLVTFSYTRSDGYLRTSVGRSVWVLKRGADRYTVYSARCTHLGCLVGSYRPGSRAFFCPCHDALYSVDDGDVIDGPPPRPLDELAWRIQEGELMVQQQDFLIGSPSRIPM